MLKKLNELRPLVVPNKPSGPTGLTDLDQMTNMRHDDLCQLMKESNKLTQVYPVVVYRLISELEHRSVVIFYSL